MSKRTFNGLYFPRPNETHLKSLLFGNSMSNWITCSNFTLTSMGTRLDKLHVDLLSSMVWQHVTCLELSLSV